MSTPKAPQVLLTAQEVFPELERLALSALDRLSMSFRILDPTTRLRSDAARELGLSTWADLVRHRVAHGVTVRLLIADFDPIFATDLHIGAWKAAHGFTDGPGPQPQILLCRHPGSVGVAWRMALAPKFRARLREIRAEDLYDRTPAIAHKAGTGQLHPCTLHQKLAVADGNRAIVGGLDVDERRFDTVDHDRPSEETWHDASLAVEGPLAIAAERHFGETWNAALQAQDSCDPEICNGTPAPLPETPERGKGFLRTVSKPRKGPSTSAPKRPTATTRPRIWSCSRTRRPSSTSKPSSSGTAPWPKPWPAPPPGRPISTAS